MRNIVEVTFECMEELDALGIKYGVIDDIIPNTRAKSRWGQCRKLPNGHYSININAVLLDERNDIIGLKETILHELCHSVEGCFNHKEPWDRVVAKVNKAYGYHIKRANSADDKKLAPEVQAKYEVSKTSRTHHVSYCIVCEKCGYKEILHRKSKAVQHPEWFSHRNCGGHFKRAY